MTKPATLIDALTKEAHTDAPQGNLAQTLRKAHRFVLDAEMSSFLVDLAHAGFHDLRPSSVYRNAEWIRESARLPFPITWIEYDSHARHKRRMEMSRGVWIDDGPAQLDEVSPWGGWLLLDHDHPGAGLYNAVKGQDGTIKGLRQTGYSCIPCVGEPDGQPVMLPFSYRWSVTDQPIDYVLGGAPADPTEEELSVASRYATGLPGYSSKHLAIASHPTKYELSRDQLRRLIREWTGELRYVWAFLATLNELPVQLTQRKGIGGYMARRQYRRYLDYTTVHLKVPARRSVQRLAKTLIHLARRKAHQVRGHWRRDWRHPGGRIWIRDHQRGDASLGFVQHDYAIERGEHP